MLYHYLISLIPAWKALNVMNYLTFRSILAFLLSLFLVLIFQPVFINWFRKRKIGQPIRSDGPETHAIKQGTPTMGGLVVVFAVVFSTIMFADLTNLYVWILIGLTLSYGVLGFCDDYSKVKDKSSKGVSAKAKLGWQFLLAFIFVSALVFLAPNYSTTVSIPFFKNAVYDLKYFYIVFGMLIVVGASNAVNLTDGLDGLVIGPVMKFFRNTFDYHKFYR